MQEDLLCCWPLVDFGVNVESNKKSEAGSA